MSKATKSPLEKKNDDWNALIKAKTASRDQYSQTIVDCARNGVSIDIADVNVHNKLTKEILELVEKSDRTVAEIQKRMAEGDVPAAKAKAKKKVARKAPQK